MMRVRTDVIGAWCALAAVSVAALLLSACGLVQEEKALATPSTPVPNDLVNYSFEYGSALWMGDGPLTADTTDAHVGQASLALGAGTFATAATQTIVPAEFPQFLSGYYYVDGSRDPAGYIEFVVTARGPAMAPDTLHFFIAGAATIPAGIDPNDAVFLSRDGPARGTWTYFGYPLWEAWVAKHGPVPLGWSEIDITLAARAGASARFDEVYAGPQSANPNKPDLSD